MTQELARIAEDSARGGFFLISGTAIAMIVMAIASILIARFLGPGLYGQYTLAFVVPQLLFLATDLGINQGIMKFTASLRAKGDTERVAEMIKYGLLLRAATGIAIFIVSYAFAETFASIVLRRPDLTFYTRITSTAILFQTITTTVTSAFVGLDKAEYHALVSNIQSLTKAIISIALVLLGFSVFGALMGNVAGYMIAACAGGSILFLMLREKRHHKSDQSVRNNLAILMRYGAPLYVSVLLTGFIPLYQNVILALFTTDTDVGNYKAAINFATLITVVTIPITTALLPAFSKLDDSTTQKLRTFFGMANKYVTMLILPIAFLVIIFSSEIVQIVYGSTYQSASYLLAVHSLVYLAVGMGYLTLSSFFSGLGETKIVLWISLISFLTVAVLSPILTQMWSVVGAIIAFLIATAAGTVYGAYAARAKFRIRFAQSSIGKIYIVSILSTLIPLFLLYLSPLPRLLNIAAGALLYLFSYLTLIPLVRIVDHQELQVIARIVRRVKPLAPFTLPVLKYLEKVSHMQKS